MATKNLVPRADEEGKLGLSDRRWLEVNAVSGSFGNFKSNELKNLVGNQLLKAGTGITIEGPSAADEGEGAQYTISASDTGSSNAEVDRIFAGPTNSEDVTTQQQAVIANYDASDSTNNKLIFKTNEADRWYIDSNGHYVPASDVTYDLGNSVDAVRNLYVGSAKQSGQGIRLVSQSGNQLSLSVKDSRFAVSSSPSLTIDGNTKYDNLLLVKSPVKVATTENLDAAYDGLSFTLTANNPGALLIDGVNAFQVEDRLLVKDQTDKTQNGIYIVTAAGDGSTEFVLTRADDLSGDIDFSGLSVSVIEGTDNAGKIFFSSSTTTGSILGTSPLVWNDFNSTGLTAIIEDSDPHLGAHLDLNTFNLFDNQSIQLLPDSVAEGEGIELSKNNLKVNFASATDPEFTIPTLSLASSADKEINIASVASSSFFTGTLSASNSFTYTFDSTLLTDTEKTAGQAIFATKGWVDSQSFLTNADLPASPDLSGYVVSDTSDSLNKLTINVGGTDVVGISMGSKNIRGLAAPIENTDAATKQYVDNTIQSVASVLDTCIVATTENLDATLNVSTLIANLNGELGSIDGYPVNSLVERDESDPNNIIIGSRILVKNQTSAIHNGIYELISKGSVGSPWSFERTSDFASGFQASGSFIYVEHGDTNKGNGFICTSDSNSDTVNTDDITFVKFSGAGEIQGGAGLTLTGNTLNINVKPDQIDDPANPGQLIANPDRFVYIDNEDNLDVSISNLVAALNDNGGITASAAADFTWPSTALSGDIASTDQFVMLDVSENPGAKKNVTAQKIKEHVLLTFDDSDISFTYDSARTNPWQAKYKDDSVLARHLDKSVISMQTIKVKVVDGVSIFKPDPGDFVLISDSNDSNELKRVSYSNFLSDLTVTPDFSSAPVLTEEELALDDKVLVLDSSNSDKVNTIPFSRVARKHDWIGVSGTGAGTSVRNNITLESDYTYIFSSRNNDTIEYTFTLPNTADELKTIEIIPVTHVNNVNDSNLGSAKVNIVLSTSKTCTYSWTDLQETSKLIFVYHNGSWRAKDEKKKRLHSYTQLVRPVNTNNTYNWGQVIALEERFFKFKDYYVFTNSEQQVTLNLPINNQINAWDNLSHNDSTRIYFLASGTIKKVTINSQGSIYKKLIGTTNSSNTSEFLVNQKVIQFNTSDIPYIDITWKKIWSNPVSGRGSEFSGWIISSPYNVEGQEAAFSLPTGATGDVLRYTEANTAEAGKVQTLNIENGAVTGGVDAQGTATGSIAATSIVGGNIANDTITNDKLKTMNNYKVLGSVTNDANADNDDPNNSVTEVNVLQSLDEEIAADNKHNNLVTAQAVRAFVLENSSQTLSSEPTSYDVYMNNVDDTFDNGNKPQSVSIFPSNINNVVNVNFVTLQCNYSGYAKNYSKSNYDQNTMLYGLKYDGGIDLIRDENYLGEIEWRNGKKINDHWDDPNKIGRDRDPLTGNNLSGFLPNRYGNSHVCLPESELWYSLYGPNTPLTLKVNFNTLDAQGVFRTNYKVFTVSFKPNPNDINSMCRLNPYTATQNSVQLNTLPAGRIPTYVNPHSLNSERHVDGRDYGLLPFNEGGILYSSSTGIYYNNNTSGDGGIYNAQDLNAYFYNDEVSSNINNPPSSITLKFYLKKVYNIRQFFKVPYSGSSSSLHKLYNHAFFYDHTIPVPEAYVWVAL
jgi:hypothetical protein